MCPRHISQGHGDPKYAFHEPNALEVARPEQLEADSIAFLVKQFCCTDFPLLSTK